MEILLLLIGITILSVTFLDFFHTTLSGQGFGKISEKLNKVLGQWILRTRNNFIYRYSGMTHLIVTITFWLLSLFLGTLIFYSSTSTMVINAETKVAADLIERIYFTGTVISTLGLGDFVPGNSLSRIGTTFLSFSGFVLLTTGLTYLISVVNTVLQKKQLAIYISTMGTDIDELYYTVTNSNKVNLLLNNSDSFRELIIKNSSNHIFFPIVKFYLATDKKAALELQLARLYDVLIILNEQVERESDQKYRIRNLLAAIANYLDLRVVDKKIYSYDKKEIMNKRRFWGSYSLKYKENETADEGINAALKSSGWSWADVYEINNAQASDFEK